MGVRVKNTSLSGNIDRFATVFHELSKKEEEILIFCKFTAEITPAPVEAIHKN